MPNNVPPSVDLEEPVIRRAEGGAASSDPFGPVALIIRDIAELDNAPVDADVGDKLIVSPDELRVILERHLQGGDAASEAVTEPTRKAWKITTPSVLHHWFTEDDDVVAHFSRLDQGHKIEEYHLTSSSTEKSDGGAA